MCAASTSMYICWRATTPPNLNWCRQRMNEKLSTRNRLPSPSSPVKDVDPKLVGVNYDVAHATIEGGLGGWINSFHISEPRLCGIAVKDFAWGKDAKGAWQAQWKPIGEGMVKLGPFFGMVAETDFAGPLQIHYEYPLGGASGGSRNLTLPREQVLGAMKKDLLAVRGHLSQAGL